MATDLQDIADVFNVLFTDSIADQIRHDVFLLNVLPTGVGRNENCTWNVKLDGRQNAIEDSGADLNLTSDFLTTNKRVNASLPWARTRSTVHVDGLAAALASQNAQGAIAGALGVSGDLFGEEVQDAVQDLTRLVAQRLYSGDPSASPVQIAGIDEVCDTGAFAAIDPAVPGNSAWAAIDETTPIGNLSGREIRDALIEPIRAASGLPPEFITCSSTVFNLLADSIADSPGYRESRNLFLSGRGERVDLGVITGIRYIQVEDVTIVQDRHCPANSLYAWNTTGVKIRYVPPKPPSFDRVAQTLRTLTGQGWAPEDIQRLFMRTEGRLAPWMLPIGRVGDSERAMIGIYAQTEWRYRNRFGRLILT